MDTFLIPYLRAAIRARSEVMFAATEIHIDIRIIRGDASKRSRMGGRRVETLEIIKLRQIPAD